MIDCRPIVRRVLCVLFLSAIAFANRSFAQDGKAIFQANCASCHAVNKKLTGPALAGVESRGPWSDRKNIHAWVHNPSGFKNTNDYAANLMKEYGITMTAFPQLSDKEIDAVIDYVNKSAATAATETPGGGGTTSEATSTSDNSILYGVLTIILAVVALVMLQVNSNLRKLADDREGVPSHEPIPFYRNKTYITLLTLILFVVGGFYVVKGAIGLGRQHDYQPEQPIFYSHKVHAGKNQISCLYCHGNAWESRHATIPSLNVCMNCHMTINEYTGKEKIYRADGSEVNGTEEIQKIYEYAGWDPGKKQYVNPGKPVQWVRIHSLPDHVYFNHSQHVRVGKVQCQTCHGEITNMDEVHQFAELSMSWCINCHRETKVDFGTEKGDGNKFYSIYKKYHDEIKAGKRDSVTVNDIGGTECQKCHY